MRIHSPIFDLIGIGGARNVAEVLLHVALGTEKALFFAGPKSDADGAARFDLQSGEDAHDFHGHDGARAVVGGACRGNPGIEMAAEHDDFVFQLGIGAGNFGDGVEAVFVIAGELGFDVHLDADGYVGLKEAVDAAIIFNRGDREGKRIGLIAMIDLDAEGGAVVVENGAAGTAVVLAVAAGK